MISTLSLRVPLHVFRRAFALIGLLLLAGFVAVGRAADSDVPRPPELERDVQFWIRVYTEINTNSGFMHDERNLAVIYDTVHFTTGASPKERQRVVDDARDRISGALDRIAAGSENLSEDDRRIRALWGEHPNAEELRDAKNYIRFQLGQSDRFREGLVRSGAWGSHIADTLSHLGLPPELAVLPHVESSFDPAAYSKVGAAGLWQFMRSTGRRYMRIDYDVDDRLDPFRSTEAAAQLLSYNYRLLGTWPLALTAYNHGAAGMRRAKDQMGTDDIVQIVRHYKSPTFGFASRNFYVSFLAALEIDRNPDKYFGSLHHLPVAKYQEVSVPAFVRVSALERALKVDRDKLRQLNPALTRAIWDGRRYVPRGYKLRLPGEGEQWTAARLTKVLAPGELLAAQPQPRRYRIARGDTLILVARRFNIAPHDLASANGLRDSAKLRPGRTLQLPEAAAASPSAVVAANVQPPKTPLAAATTPTPAAGRVPEAVAQQESKEEAAAVAAVAKPSQAAQPVSAAQADEISPAIGPAAENTASADPFDYSVSKQDTITVAGGETLGHYADWLGETAARLRAINRMKFTTPVIVGRQVKLEFTRVSRDKFEETRREYHRALQANYFAAHRISGTEVYVVKRGDSTWTVMKRYGGLPLWLIQQYNPDADLTAMRPGTQIVMPRVEEVASTEAGN